MYLMTPSELIDIALTAGCTLVRPAKNWEFTFSCPPKTPSCGRCYLWEHTVRTGCLFWDKGIVPTSLHFEATRILQVTHPELFI